MNYFDYAAATPVSETVAMAMQPYASVQFYNPSAVYLAAQAVKRDIDAARATVAGILGAKPVEIIFTAGGTESDNLAIRGVMEAYPGANCIASAVEHDAVLEPAKQYPHKLAPVGSDGRINLAELEKLIDEDTVLVSIMYANNETGTIQPLAAVANMLQQIREHRVKTGNSLPLYFHSDACQAANYLKLLVHTMGVDLLTLNGGKIYGPKQLGILYASTGVKLAPQILGGGQERGKRSGTENVSGIIGFAAALAEAQAMREAESTRLAGLQKNFSSWLARELPHCSINGSIEHRLPNNMHITIPGSDNETVMMQLDETGIMVATGSACSASSDEPSHVLKAMGLSDEDAQSSLRITMGRGTTAESVKRLTDVLESIAK